MAAEETLGFVIVDVARLLRQQFDSALENAGLGLTAGEARTLHHAAVAGPLRQTLLAERMAVEPMTVVGYLDRLERAGLIERLTDPDDRRAKLVTPTAAAAPVLLKIGEVGAAVRQQATHGISPAEIAALRDQLALMRRNLGGAPTPALERVR
ncbi:MarR family winged helix-turn-helix transcriptional regulator [Chthonobacter albigriseus]|uniref:MarR family winged helix-turn-helix transcriptional regulator n=1 Tax=Chthonobacter albigriseus TaxID=1683161 RepID=UPI0015EF72D6|nr:MarR family transcriptional regulator [Chthonobacter albigriseus]